MPVTFTKTKCELSGDCTVEEAETVFGWLNNTPKGTLALAKLTHAHAAVLQAIMATTHRISALPKDPFMAECILQARQTPPSRQTLSSQTGN